LEQRRGFVRPAAQPATERPRYINLLWFFYNYAHEKGVSESPGTSVALPAEAVVTASHFDVSSRSPGRLEKGAPAEVCSWFDSCFGAVKAVMATATRMSSSDGVLSSLVVCVVGSELIGLATIDEIGKAWVIGHLYELEVNHGLDDGQKVVVSGSILFSQKL
jgi:hypothetical protein